MNLPRTAKLVAAAVALAGVAIIYSADAFHWTDAQTAASSAAAAALIALAGFVVEHLRAETPSRWVGVFGMIPPAVTTVATLGIAFAWWGESAVKVSGLVVGVVATIAGLAGVAVAQANVFSPETHELELEETATTVAAAKAVDPAVHAK